MAKTKRNIDSIPRVSYRTILKRARSRRNKSKSILSDPSDGENISKRYVKFLSICNNPKTLSTVLRSAPDPVIKRICDAALNAAEGEIPIDDYKKKLFHRNRKVFSTLIDRQVPIKRKRRYLANQKGGALPLIPILLSTVLGTVGSLLFKRD